MKSEDAPSTFMSEVYSGLRAGQGDLSPMERDSTAIDTSIGPCVVMGALSWLVLFSLYHWLA